MKVIKYQYLSAMVGNVPYLIDKSIPYSVENEEIAKAEAYNGEYTIEGDRRTVIAPRNVIGGEYINVDGVLYLATMNIPNGEPIIVGQNAVETTIEEQLYELKGE